MQRRLDKLAEIGTSSSPFRRRADDAPELDQIVRHIRSHGMIAGLISNGYYFTPDRIKRLNDAGLEYLQISIDNVAPDEVSRKSLRVLDKKLRYWQSTRISHQHQFSHRRGSSNRKMRYPCEARGRAGLFNHRGRYSRRRRDTQATDGNRKADLSLVKKLGNRITLGSIGFR